MARISPKTDFGLPIDVAEVVLSFVADAIVFANGETAKKWGLTNQVPDFF
jgi:hypothetical protein